MDTFIQVAQLLLSLSFLVAIHEWGHMFAAKRFGMWVERFSIFFAPVIKKKFSDDPLATEYCIGWIPLGGFVKIAGHMDESMDKEQLAQEPKPYEFRSKPAWQRLIVMLGGIIVNFIVGMVVFIFVFYSYGESYLPVSELKQGIGVGQVAYNMGLRDGDKIINVNGKEVEDFADIVNQDVLLSDNMYYTVSRNGQEIKIDIPRDLLDQIESGKKINEFVRPYFPFSIDSVVPGSNAAKAGLQAGDRILSVDTVDALHYDRFSSTLFERRGDTVPMKVDRNGSVVALEAIITPEGKLGFYPKPLISYEYKTRYYTFAQSIPRGIKEGFGVFTSNIKAFKKIFAGEASFLKTINSPIGMLDAYGTTWNWHRFWLMTGLISVALAFMNLLPIPALDGGHVIFLLYEMVTGRKPGDKFLEKTQQVGVIILLTLMVVLFTKDIWFKWFS